jgi:hypothetical protein
MTKRVTCEPGSKEVKLDGRTLCDAVSPEAALVICNALTYIGLEATRIPVQVNSSLREFFA